MFKTDVSVEEFMRIALDPLEEKLERCLPNQAVRTYRNGDILEGVGMLAGFQLEISTIWPE